MPLIIQSRVAAVCLTLSIVTSGWCSESKHESTVDNGPFQIRVHYATTVLTTAEAVPVEVCLTAPISARLERLEASTANIDGFRIEFRHQDESVAPNAYQVRAVWHYRARPFLPGQYSLPGFAAEWDFNGQTVLLETAPVAAQVESVLKGNPEDAEASELIPYPRTGRSRTSWTVGLPGALLLLSLAAFGIDRVRKGRS